MLSPAPLNTSVIVSILASALSARFSAIRLDQRRFLWGTVFQLAMVGKNAVDQLTLQFFRESRHRIDPFLYHLGTDDDKVLLPASRCRKASRSVIR